jgi:hypothetical protein
MMYRRCPGQGSIRALLEQKSTVLPLGSNDIRYKQKIKNTFPSQLGILW